MHQAVNCALGWRLNVNEAVVGANFKVLSRVLVNKRATQDTKSPCARRQGNGSRYFRPRALDSIDDFRR